MTNEVMEPRRILQHLEFLSADTLYFEYFDTKVEPKLMTTQYKPGNVIEFRNTFALRKLRGHRCFLFSYGIQFSEEHQNHRHKITQNLGRPAPRIKFLPFSGCVYKTFSY